MVDEMETSKIATISSKDLIIVNEEKISIFQLPPKIGAKSTVIYDGINLILKGVVIKPKSITEYKGASSHIHQ